MILEYSIFGCWAVVRFFLRRKKISPARAMMTTPPTTPPTIAPTLLDFFDAVTAEVGVEDAELLAASAEDFEPVEEAVLVPPAKGPEATTPGFWAAAKAETATEKA